MREPRPNAWLDEPALTPSQAHEYLTKSAFVPGRTRKVGVELEWLVYDPTRPDYLPELTTITSILNQLGEPLPAGSLTSTEPGGQPELATAPAADLHQCLDATALDLHLFRDGFATAGLTLTGVGLDPIRSGACLVNGRRQRTLIPLSMPDDPLLSHPTVNTAGTQINVDCGDDSTDQDDWRGWVSRWRLLHHLGPLLTAAFANSPFRSSGVPTGAMSTRQLSRFSYLTTRSEPPQIDGDIREQWVHHILNSSVLFTRTARGPWHVPTSAFTMREWLAGAGPRRATLDDLKYHTTTVWPPIRARGYYELRMIDALPGDWWVVPTVLVNALLEDGTANAIARDAVEPLYRDVSQMELWRSAAYHGPAATELAGAVPKIFAATADALDRLGIAPHFQLIFNEYHERYGSQGRCPAQDLLLDKPEVTLGFAPTAERVASKEPSRWTQRSSVTRSRQIGTTASSAPDTVSSYDTPAASNG